MTRRVVPAGMEHFLLSGIMCWNMPHQSRFYVFMKMVYSYNYIKTERHTKTIDYSALSHKSQ